jgi:hypothetical protein
VTTCGSSGGDVTVIESIADGALAAAQSSSTVPKSVTVKLGTVTAPDAMAPASGVRDAVPRPGPVVHDTPEVYAGAVLGAGKVGLAFGKGFPVPGVCV